jgi:hypothetical protein
MRGSLDPSGGKELVCGYRDFRSLAALMVAFAGTSGLPQAFALGTSYEAKISGFVHSTLQTIITGEFAGRRPSQAEAPPQRPVCRPNDYDDLRAAANNTAAFDALHRRCKFVEVKINETHVVGTAFLPSGYCETLKRAYDDMLARHVYAVTDEPQKWSVEFEYKGSRYLFDERAVGERRATADEM